MSLSTKKIAFAAVVGAAYAALTVALSGIAYGPVQFRVAEALCILPFFIPAATPGLFVGCIIANMFSPYPIDMIVGPIATLLAVTCTMMIGKANRESLAAKIAACAPPVIFNAVIIGAMIAYMETGFGSDAFLKAMLTFGFQVGAGELAVMYILGLPLIIFLPKTRLFETLAPGLAPEARDRRRYL